MPTCASTHRSRARCPLRSGPPRGGRTALHRGECGRAPQVAGTAEAGGGSRHVHPRRKQCETLSRKSVAASTGEREKQMDSGDAAWVLVSAALVLFMTPGLAFFYGGMDRSRNVLNMLMMNFWCLLIVPVLWVVGRLLAGPAPATATFIGNFDFVFLKDIGISPRTAAAHARHRRLPRHVRRDHPGADLGRRRRPHEVLGLGDLRAGLDAPRLRARSFKWVYGGWLGSARARSTSPAAPPSTSTPASPPSPPCSCSASARAGRARATRRTRCRWSCSAPASCGSAGSASTPARPSPPTARPSRRS